MSAEEAAITLKLQERWTPMFEALKNLPKEGSDTEAQTGATLKADSLLEAQIWWKVSDDVGETLDAESFHWLLTQTHLCEEDLN